MRNILPAKIEQTYENLSSISSSRLSFLRNPRQYAQRNRKRFIRYSLLTGNLAVVIAVIVMVILHSGDIAGNYSALNTASETETSNPLDRLSSADVAANIAIMAALPETGLIITDANTVTAELNSAIESGDTVLKPQILSPSIKTKADIIDYIVKKGDTLSSLASKFGVTSDSIRWSNNLTGLSLTPGIKIVIPPVNGIVYTVRSGDTPSNLASRFNVSAEQIVRFNDAELTGLKVGERIVIPGGVFRGVGGTPFYARFAFGNTAIYGYNGYVPGYCTWYVANKRIQIGRPLPANLGNAYQWDDLAARAGFKVNKVPAPGAAIVTNTVYNPGHVAYVEQVYYNPNGSLKSVLVTEMNRNRLYEITSRTFSASEAVTYNYIH